VVSQSWVALFGCEFLGFVIVIWMFWLRFMLAPFRVEMMPSSTFRVTFCTYGFSGSVFPLMSMLR